MGAFFCQDIQAQSATQAEMAQELAFFEPTRGLKTKAASDVDAAARPAGAIEAPHAGDHRVDDHARAR